MKKILMALFAFLFLLPTQKASAKTIVDQVKLSDHITVTHYSEGWISKSEWKEVTHSNCRIQVPENTASAVQIALINFGYHPILSNSQNPATDDELKITDLAYSSYVNSHGCGETDLTLTMSYSAGGVWSPFVGFSNFIECMADETQSPDDVEGIFGMKLMPHCVMTP